LYNAFVFYLFINLFLIQFKNYQNILICVRWRCVWMLVSFLNNRHTHALTQPQFLCATVHSVKHVVAIAILSVHPGVTFRYQIKPRWDRDSGFLSCNSIESIVSCKQILCSWVRRFSSNKSFLETRSRYFTAISLSMRMVADRHRLGALLTTFPGVPMSMMLNDLEIEK